MSQLETRLATIESTQAEILRLLRGTQPKPHYTTKEFAQVVGRSDDYIRELCRDGRLRFARTRSGRGGKPEFRLSSDEIARFQAEGPLRRMSQ